MRVACRTTVAAVLLCLASHAHSTSGLQETERKPAAPLVLTNDRATGSFPISPETLAAAPRTLSVSISKVTNPEKTPFEVLVYLSVRRAAPAEPHKILIGNFSLYPPDHAAGFLLSTSQAFQKLQADGASAKSLKVRLLVEIKRIHEDKPWTPIAITVPPPKWRDD